MSAWLTAPQPTFQPWPFMMAPGGGTGLLNAVPPISMQGTPQAAPGPSGGGANPPLQPYPGGLGGGPWHDTRQYPGFGLPISNPGYDIPNGDYTPPGFNIPNDQGVPGQYPPQPQVSGGNSSNTTWGQFGGPQPSQPPQSDPYGQILNPAPNMTNTSTPVPSLNDFLGMSQDSGGGDF